MNRRPLGFLAGIAAFAAFCGLHLEIASGHAFDRPAPGDARLQTGVSLAAAGINRAAKTDRLEIALSEAEGRTITFRHPELPSTTVAVRVWETAGIGKNRPVVKQNKAPVEKRKQAVACEPVVSALTEVAKHLDAGRCVT